MPLTKNKLKQLRELSHKKFREERKQFIVEGARLVKEALDSDFRVAEAYHTKEFAEDAQGRALVKRLRGARVAVSETTMREMEQIAETVHFQGIMAVVGQKQFSPDMILQKNQTNSRLAAFDSVSDPGNLGTMIRTCDWFGVDGILIGRNSVELHNPKVVRATMGGVFHLPVAEDVDLLSTLSKARELGYRIYVTDLKGETHFDHVNYDGKAILVFGNEAWGVSDQIRRLADYRVMIRRYGTAESLNVSVACGVILSRVHRLYE